jgi:hypothetical protein
VSVELEIAADGRQEIFESFEPESSDEEEEDEEDEDGQLDELSKKTERVELDDEAEDRGTGVLTSQLRHFVIQASRLALFNDVPS